MNRKSLTWLVLGVCVSITGILNVVHTNIGLPVITHNGFFWERLERNNWIAHQIKLTYEGNLHIGKLELSEQSLQSTTLSSSATKDYTDLLLDQFKKWIQSVHLNGLDLHWNDTLYQTELVGNVYPFVQLKNDWISIEKPATTSHWNVSGQLDSTTLPLNLDLPDMFPVSLGINLNFDMTITGIEEPIVGTINNTQFTHPLLGRTIRIPHMALTVRKSKDRWVGNVSNENSTLDWIWIDIEQHNSGEKSLGDDLEWAINYNISLSDLTDWFQVNIPISRPTGHWAGTLTPTEATISSSNLGFEGKIYALNRLQAGQPITYQPIHAEHTQLIGPNTPSWIPYPQLGWLAKSVIAGEDAPFYTHDGFNEEGLNRALNELLKDKDNPIGGSSITQQVAKNLFTGNQTTLDRKIEEMVYTLGLEATLSKEAILALYLNSIEFGDGIYGVREASKQYFLKEPKYLSLKEAVFLASILPNPRDGYRRAKRGYPPTRRMKAILQNLVDGNQISSVIMKETMKEPLRLLLPVD